jgi:hypothetical protein
MRKWTLLILSLTTWALFAGAFSLLNVQQNLAFLTFYWWPALAFTNLALLVVAIVWAIKNRPSQVANGLTIANSLAFVGYGLWVLFR